MDPKQAWWEAPFGVYMLRALSLELQMQGFCGGVGIWLFNKHSQVLFMQVVTVNRLEQFLFILDSLNWSRGWEKQQDWKTFRQGP